jgi:hypothetical protein
MILRGWKINTAGFNTIPLVSYHLAGGNYRYGKKLICYALPSGTRNKKRPFTLPGSDAEQAAASNRNGMAKPFL